VVKSKTQEIVDKASEEVAEVKEAAADKMGEIIQDTSEEVTELKDATGAKLQGMFKQKDEAPADPE
jgi:tryptophanyl-tRNA synthetase